jgi:hypothetical protein
MKLLHLLVLLAAGPLTTKGIWGVELGNRILAYGSVTLCALTALSATIFAVSWEHDVGRGTLRAGSRTDRSRGPLRDRRGGRP